MLELNFNAVVVDGEERLCSLYPFNEDVVGSGEGFKETDTFQFFGLMNPIQIKVVDFFLGQGIEIE
jgi:hypothetical protein